MGCDVKELVQNLQRVGGRKMIKHCKWTYISSGEHESCAKYIRNWMSLFRLTRNARHLLDDSSWMGDPCPHFSLDFFYLSLSSINTLWCCNLFHFLKYATNLPLYLLNLLITRVKTPLSKNHWFPHDFSVPANSDTAVFEREISCCTRRKPFRQLFFSWRGMSFRKSSRE